MKDNHIALSICIWTMDNLLAFKDLKAIYVEPFTLATVTDRAQGSFDQST